ncbi:MAG: hypothetical protein U9N46_05840, partial [Euryarchaeota archaeon]|nr:hypothetical protein [Euryarchaeota archaeon]
GLFLCRFVNIYIISSQYKSATSEGIISNSWNEVNRRWHELLGYFDVFLTDGLLFSQNLSERD